MATAGAPSITPEEQELFNVEAVQSNLLALTSIRSQMAIVAGIGAGVLGFTGFSGFIFYVLVHMCIAGAVVFRMGFNASEYVPKMSNVGMLTAGIGDNMISYVLFWTLGYALVHIY